MFQNHYGGSGDEYGSTCLQTGDGGYIMTGSTDSYGLGGNDIYIIRTNEYGDTLWTKTYGGTGYDVSTDIIQTNDGGFAILGRTNSFGAGNLDCYLLKINQNGDTVWTKTYGNTGSESGYCIIETTDNGFLISGESSSFGPVSGSIYIIRTNVVGDTLWTKYYYKQDFNTGFDIIQSIDGNFIIGVTLSNTVTTHDFMLLKIDNLGDTIWTKVYNKGGDDWLASIVELSNGDIVVSGRTNSIGYGGVDAFLARYNSIGDEVWFETYGGIDNDYGGQIIITTDSGLVVSGTTSSFGYGQSDVFLFKTNLSGDTLWTKTYGGTDDDFGGHINQTTDGGFIAAGSTHSFGNGREYYLIKTNSSGFAGIEQMEIEENTITVYPNPNNGEFAIVQNSSVLSSPILSVFDLNGHLLISKRISLGSTSKSYIDLSLLKSGEYLLVFTEQNTTISKKLIINK